MTPNQSTVSGGDTRSSQNITPSRMNFNDSFQADQLMTHCCCERLAVDLKDIKEEITALKLERRPERENYQELHQLRVELAEKRNMIKNLVDERDSYKLALSLLMKEIASSNYSVPKSSDRSSTVQISDDESDAGFKVVKSKKKSKAQSQPQQQNRAQLKTNKKSFERSNESSRPKVTQQGDSRKHVMILGDSIIKHVEGWRIGRSTETKTSVKSFPGASVKDCYDYFKPAMNSKPDEVIIHIGTNDLKSKSARETAESVVDLAKWTESSFPTVKIRISESTCRNDQEELGHKVVEANKILKKFCSQHHWGLICHQDIDENCLNRSRLHLNKKGTGLIASNFIKYIISK